MQWGTAVHPRDRDWQRFLRVFYSIINSDIILFVLVDAGSAKKNSLWKVFSALKKTDRERCYTTDLQYLFSMPCHQWHGTTHSHFDPHIFLSLHIHCLCTNNWPQNKKE